MCIHVYTPISPIFKKKQLLFLLPSDYFSHELSCLNSASCFTFLIKFISSSSFLENRWVGVFELVGDSFLSHVLKTCSRVIFTRRASLFLCLQTFVRLFCFPGPWAPPACHPSSSSSSPPLSEVVSGRRCKSSAMDTSSPAPSPGPLLRASCCSAAPPPSSP